MASNLQVVVAIQSQLNGLREATAELQVMRVETEKLNAAGKSQVSFAQQLVREEAAHSAELAQQAAIASQSQVIAQTRLDLVAATVKGEEAQAAILRSELQIREATLGVMRAEVLSAADLNKLTASEAALLATVAAETEAGAAGSLLAGANLSKARGEALTLSRELATGSVNARTMGALIGSFGNALTVAGITGFVLVEGIKGAVEEAEKFDRDVEKFTKGISDAVTATNRLARESEDLGDTIKISDKWTVELAQVEVKMAEFRARQLGFWASFIDGIVKMFADAMNSMFASSSLHGIELDTRGPFKRAADKDVADANTAATQALQKANEALKTSIQARGEWAKALADPAAGLDFYKQKIDELKAKLETIDLSTLEGQKQFNATLHDLDDATSKAGQLNKQLDKNNKTIKEGRTEIVAFGREVSATIEAIRQQQQLIDASIRLGPDQKNAATIDNTRQEIAALNAEAEKGRALLAGGTLDPATYAQVSAGVQKTRFEVALLNEKLDKLEHPIFASLSEWLKQLGTAMDQVGNAITSSINTALDATASALTDLIFRTGNWRQTVLQAEKAIVGSLIKIGLEMLIQATIGKFIRNQTTRDQVQSNSQVTASAIPAAAAQTGATGGSNWIIGAIAAAAAIAAIVALLSGGFEKGGYTGPGGSKAIAGVVHGQEYVHPKDVVDHYGLRFMTAVHQRKLPPRLAEEWLSNYRYTPATPRLGSFEMGGAVAAIQQEQTERERGDNRVRLFGRGEQMKVVVVHDMYELKRELQKDTDMERWVVNTVTHNAAFIPATGYRR